MASEKPTQDEEHLSNLESDNNTETNEVDPKLIALRRDPINPTKPRRDSSSIEGDGDSVTV